MPFPRGRARIGDLEFDTRYADPIVDVDTEANTVEKTTVTEDIIVQQLGRRADRIHVEGIIIEDDVYQLDQLVSEGVVSVRTHRWTGEAIVEAASSNYTSSYDINPDAGNISDWVYEVTIDLIEVNEVLSRASSLGARREFATA